MCNLLQILKNRALKKLITLLFLFSAVQSYSQELPFDLDWYLFEINISGQDIPIPNNDELDYIQANFYIGTPDFFETSACNSCDGEVIVEGVSFGTIEYNLSCTLGDCINSDNSYFDNTYLAFFQNPNPFDFEIGWIDGLLGPGETILWITAQNGDYVVYTDLQPLSTEGFSKFEFAIFPNPTEDRFYISSNFNLDNLLVLIYDITGKLILSEENITSIKPIDIRNLKKGIYFVSISDKKGNTSVKKIIKN